VSGRNGDTAAPGCSEERGNLTVRRNSNLVKAKAINYKRNRRQTVAEKLKYENMFKTARKKLGAEM
jgi:hypothetical protein